MLAPIELMRLIIDGTIERGLGRIVNIISIAVNSSVGELCLSNGIRPGLIGFLAGLARKTIHQSVVINNLLPGSIETDRLSAGLIRRAEGGGIPFNTVRQTLMNKRLRGRIRGSR